MKVARSGRRRARCILCNAKYTTQPHSTGMKVSVFNSVRTEFEVSVFDSCRHELGLYRRAVGFTASPAIIRTWLPAKSRDQVTPSITSTSTDAPG